MSLADRQVNPLEKHVQARVVRIYETFGCFVAKFSQPRPTMQTEGIPDLYVMHPRGFAWWHETKRPRGGRQSAAQREFERHCKPTPVPYLKGGTDVAYQHLATLGILVGPALRLRMPP